MNEDGSTIMEPKARPDQSPPANGLKRQQSEMSEDLESKRPRMSPGKNSPEDSRTADRSVEGGKGSPQTKTQPEDKGLAARRRGGGVVDEKQRSRRLFGGLLGSLNQPGDRTSKRRQEIESRRKAELQRQDDERLEDKQRRLEQLAERRKSVKRRMDDDIMRARHDDMLSRAHFLQTKTEPKLFYKPWDTRPEEEDRIDEQVRLAKTQIDDELAEIELLRPKDEGDPSHQDGDGPSDPSPHPHANIDGTADTKPNEERNGVEPNIAPAETDGTGQTESNAIEEKQEPDDATLPKVTNNVPPTQEVHQVEENTVEHASAEKDTTEHDDEHVVEGEEDTVIY